MIRNYKKISFTLISIIVLVFSLTYTTFADGAKDSVKKKIIRKIVKNPVGKEFWLCFQRNYKETGKTKSDKLMLELFITGDFDAKVRVSINALKFRKDTLIPAGTVVNIKIPSKAEIVSYDEISKLSVHITSDQPISVYGLNRRFQTTDSYLGMPVRVLGKEYRAMCFSESEGLLSQFAVIATENNTKVSIVPSNNTVTFPKGIEFSITLNRGDVYQVIARYEPFSACDLTGTYIKSNKRIAVFSGHQCAYVPVDTIACNHLVEQLPPISSWGRHFYLGKFKGRIRYSFRILAHKNDTKIFEDNEVIKTLQAGEYFDRIADKNVQISATKPILVAQFSHGYSDGDNIGDPMMILISPTQQFLKAYRFATPINGSWNHYINVVVPNKSINTMRLNGKAISSSEFEQLGISRYSIAYLKVPFGTHILTGAQPFGMYSYGFGYKGKTQNDAYDAYGTMGGQSFIEYEIEKDTIPPEIDFEMMDGFTQLIFRDDRIDDSGIRHIRLLESFGIEAEINEVTEGSPQASIKIKPTKSRMPGRLLFEVSDMVLNKTLYTVCYNFDKDEERYTFYISEGEVEKCDVDPGIQVGAFGRITASMSSPDFRSSGNLTALGSFSKTSGVGGYGGIIIGRQIQPDMIVSLRIAFENHPGILEAADDSIYSFRDSETNELVPFQESTDLSLDAIFLNFGLAYEWYLENSIYFLGGLNLSFAIDKDISVNRRIIIPENSAYLNGKREKPYPKAPNELNSLSSVRFGLFGGVGFNYDFTYRWSAFTESVYTHYFSNMINDGTWGLQQLSLHIGFRYRFK